MPEHPQISRFVTMAPWKDPFLREIFMTPDRSFDPVATRTLLEQGIDALDVGTDGLVVVSAERLSGHAATGGYDAVRIARRLAAVAPDARVFWVVREQVGMLESEYRQLVREGSPATLEAFLHGPPRLGMRVGFDLGHYEYDLLADAYAEQFGRSNVALFDFGALTADPETFLREVASFLEIEPWPTLPEEVLRRRVNQGLPRRLMGVRRFMNHFERGGLNPYPLVALKPRWRAPLSYMGSRLSPPKQPFFDATTTAWIRERYEASNHRLLERYGVDLR